MFSFFLFVVFLATSFVVWPVVLFNIGLDELRYKQALAGIALLVSLFGFVGYAAVLSGLAGLFVSSLSHHSLPFWANAAALLVYVVGYFVHLKIDAKIAPMPT